MRLKKFILVILAVTMSGCGGFDRADAMLTRHSKICVDGVQYIQFTRGASVSYATDYATDGKIKLCN